MYRHRTLAEVIRPPSSRAEYDDGLHHLNILDHGLTHETKRATALRNIAGMSEVISALKQARTRLDKLIREVKKAGRFVERGRVPPRPATVAGIQGVYTGVSYMVQSARLIHSWVKASPMARQLLNFLLQARDTLKILVQHGRYGEAAAPSEGFVSLDEAQRIQGGSR